MDNIAKDPVVYWDKKVPDTELERFQKIIERKHNVKFDTYWDLHKWTVENYTTFLEEMWQFFKIIHSKPYEEVLVKTGPGFLDNEWFKGARLNYAENMLRIRDNTIALICLDEFGNEDIVTFAEMFEEVKLYAAAFRKNGLKIGDRVACFMSNRKEAIFAMFATASIGAIWGGSMPFYGASFCPPVYKFEPSRVHRSFFKSSNVVPYNAYLLKKHNSHIKAASHVISTMEPKFLITVDEHQDNGIRFPTSDYLPVIVENAPSLEKVIVVVTQDKTRKKDLKNIRSCIFLENFLEDGRTPDGKVPDVIFEQLPFDHPLFVCFTSGTTGLHKAVVHSAGSVLSRWQDFAFTFNFKSGDIFCMNYSVGWGVWDDFIQGLAFGITYFLYCGSVYYTLNGLNFWDILAKYKVAFVSFVTCMVDKMEKLHMKPSPESDLSSLRIIEIGSTPVKRHNIEYLLTIKKDVFIGNSYGATEFSGIFAGFNMNMPAYVGELQVPTLGIDFHCFDSSGKSVVGKEGDAVICSPAINFPIGLWKDKNKSRITDIYLSKFSGVWAEDDLYWINPKTKGIVVICRSDDTIKQKGGRFGAADVYFAIQSLDELEDYICVSQQKYNGDCRAVLFVKMRQGLKLTPEIKVKIEKKVDEELWEDCVPELILEIPDIPYNVNNKRLESLVRKILEKNEIPEVMNIRNPECLKYYVNIPEVLNYNQQ